MRRAASTSMHNLQELVDPGGKDSMQARIAALEAEETEIIDKTQRVIIVCNSLPLKMKADPEGAATRGHSWHFELDPDSIYGQSAGGILSGTSVEKVIFLGGLGSEVEIYEQDSVAADLADRFNCIPVFLGAELKEKHYKGFTKQFLWPLMHYVLPMSRNPPRVQQVQLAGLPRRQQALRGQGGGGAQPWRLWWVAPPHAPPHVPS